MGAPRPERVKAVAMTAPGKMEMRTYPFPKSGEDSAVLKVEMAGICGTDKHIYKGKRPLSVTSRFSPISAGTK